MCYLSYSESYETGVTDVRDYIESSEGRVGCSASRQLRGLYLKREINLAAICVWPTRLRQSFFRH